MFRSLLIGQSGTGLITALGSPIVLLHLVIINIMCAEIDSDVALALFFVLRIVNNASAKVRVVQVQVRLNRTEDPIESVTIECQ